VGLFEQRLNDGLARRRAEGLYRERLTLAGPQGSAVTVGGRELVNFCSNDYLGLANHPAVVEAWQRGARQYGVGSGASHLVCGHSAAHEALEGELAGLTGRPRALLFSSGFMANLGVLSAVLQRGDAVFEDRLNHASLLDGGLASGARFSRFRHNDVTDLRRRLRASDADGRLVVVDAVFSMDGDSAPLHELAALCRAEGAWLMADDAHGFGVFGEQGAGLAADLPCADLPILMATLGKALGVQGAFVAGSSALIEWLIQRARSYIYTTALPAAAACAASAALSVLRDEPWRREHLQRLVARFRSGAAAAALPLMDSGSAIQPLVVGAPGDAVRLSQRLRERGFLVAAIRPPTVPAGTARLRVTLSAAHSEAQVDALLDAVGSLWRKGAISA